MSKKTSKKSPKSPPKIRRFYKFKTKMPSRKLLGRIVKGVVKSIDRAEHSLREGERLMAKREEASKRPVTIRQIKTTMKGFL